MLLINIRELQLIQMNNWEMNDGAPCGRILCIFFKIFSKNTLETRLVVFSGGQTPNTFYTLLSPLF